ncbi:MAG: hypothetical protein COY75_05235 [Nitrospirae bacterium CG_4_10_14_0_8_um_filter_41_23]|nr:MAG: hypothetical protein COV68_04030 [Nitrospirae bacterium CG11_big_fil_rev_8_21_14_0_20_41_14]PIV44273.1 MAG: hypothetical protein COS27_02305 [Nitrospirae bacterium CG02_land_8_20_14_3_00_41_53]PIW87900.1 MAG: hypothetical protein COZ94_02620 [Nitrospirae bacterium CG_4_8_14_3_um_filter_41_47]PIY86962.1 MAG: hypothetical protein COY75_05235 [Nitrospirae bacterium CG_4_10_14_0_8_um_filter_41_23]PJA79974.1 MAG: hypothetical protein CO148_05470 [Nitrospirae bacterium CG_4_9_14_3_um_filter_4
MAIGFSQNFGLELKLLSTTLNAFSQKNQVSRMELMRLLGVGDNKAEALVTWLKYIGLRDNVKQELTSLGEALIKFDPYLEEVFTQWIIHYKLASNPEAEVWYILSNEFLPNQTQFSYYDALDFLISKGLHAKNDNHLKADVSIFLRSFISESALNKTGYLKTDAQVKRIVSQNKFYKNPTADIPPYLIAYVIFEQREKNSLNLSTITIKELLTLKGNVGRIFSLSREKLEEILKLLSSPQYNQLVYLATSAGLDQVGLKFKGNSLEIIKMYYIKERKR